MPPSRHIYCINPKTWVVQTMFPTAANRPHGIGWEGKYLWVTDSNLNAFHKHDSETGAIVEKIVLRDSDPLPHGMTIRNGWMWYCDDVGVICRLKAAESDRLRISEVRLPRLPCCLDPVLPTVVRFE